MSAFIIEHAPGKELIPFIIDKQLYTDVVSFYTIRVNWYRYPLIHDGDVTYGLFDDLISRLDYENSGGNRLLQYVLQIAKDETDKRFLNALYLLHDLCVLAGKYSYPSVSEIAAIKALHNRVQRLSFLPNITLYWERILSYIAKDESVNRNELAVDSNDYKSCMNLNFPAAGNGTADGCPKTTEEIKTAIQHLNGVFQPLQFIRSAVIESEKFWLWLYQNKNEEGISWYITIKENASGYITLRKHLLLKGLEKTPGRLLLDCYYLEREYAENERL